MSLRSHSPTCALRVLAALFAGVASLTCAASDTARDDESIYLSDDLPVVLSASRLSQALRDAPGAVTIIDHEQIRASGLRDISDLLRLVPGFTATLAYGSYPVAAYHGLTRDRSNRMLVLIDGRSAYSPYFLGGIEWNLLGVDIEDIERIEVFRGSNSVTYGSNAFLGVVNITTRNAHAADRASISVQSGSDGIRDSSGAVTVGSGDFDMRLRAREQRDDGFDGFFDGRRIRLVDMRGDYRIDNARSLEFHAGDTHAYTARGYADDLGDPERWQYSQLGYGLLRYRQAVDAGNEWSLTAYQQRERSRDDYTQVYDLLGLFGPSGYAALAKYGLPPVLTLDFNYGYTTNRSDLEFQQTLALSPALRGTWGLGWRADELDAPLHFYGRGPIGTHERRLFGNVEWRASQRWLVNAGAMLENTSLSGTTTAPRLAVNYHLDDQQTFRFAWSRAFRAPTPFEVDSDIKYTYGTTVLRWTDKPAGSLEPERVTAIELGYLGEWRKQGVTLDTRLYSEKLDDLIQDLKLPLTVPNDQLDPRRPEVRTSINGAQARTLGLEYQLTWRPTRRNWVSLSQNFMNIRSNEDKNLASAPHHTTVLSIAHSFDGGINLSATHYRYGSMNWQQTPGVDDIPPYHRTDLRLGKDLRAGKTRGEVFLVAQYLGQSNSEFKPRYATHARLLVGTRWEY